MVCNKCQAQLPDGSEFCDACAIGVEDSTSNLDGHRISYRRCWIYRLEFCRQTSIEYGYRFIGIISITSPGHGKIQNRDRGGKCGDNSADPPGVAAGNSSESGFGSELAQRCTTTTVATRISPKLCLRFPATIEFVQSSRPFSFYSS